MNRSLARILKRSSAYLLDIALLFAILAPAATLVEWALGIFPKTPTQIYLATMISFSLPTWLYFLTSDCSRSGATLGKRVFHMKVTRSSGARVGLWRSLARTAIKLLPWELAHIFGFALAGIISTSLQTAGLIAANVLVVVYGAVLIATRGKQSMHDLLAKTQCDFHEEDSLP
mgnify:CR=1